MPNYGENIRARREALGISQVGLAEMIGETKQTIWKYESGTVTNIPLPKVEAIAKALHCSTEDITGWGAKKEPVTLSHDELDMELMKRLMQLTPEELEKVDSFAQGILASR